MELYINGKHGFRLPAAIEALLDYGGKELRERTIELFRQTPPQVAAVVEVSTGQLDVSSPPHPSLPYPNARAILEEWLKDIGPPGPGHLLETEAMEIMAEAESEYHACPKEKVMLHEAKNAVPLFAVMAFLRTELDIGDLRLVPPIRLGTGRIEFSHGKFELPAPATKYIVEKYSLPAEKEGRGELLTPSAAAYLAASRFSTAEAVPPVTYRGRDKNGICEVSLK